MQVNTLQSISINKTILTQALDRLHCDDYQRESAFHAYDRGSELYQEFYDEEKCIKADKRFSGQGRQEALGMARQKLTENIESLKAGFETFCANQRYPLQLIVDSWRLPGHVDIGELREIRELFLKLTDQEQISRFLEWSGNYDFDKTVEAIRTFPLGFCPLSYEILQQGAEIQNKRRFPKETAALENWSQIEKLVIGLLNIGSNQNS